MKSRYDNEMELEFLSRSKNEAFARITVAAFAAQLDPTIEELADIKTAVSEAVTNCIIHGYEDSEGMVKLKATLLDHVLEIEISDQGKGIEDVELARKPLYTSKANLERSGMGFTIMESFMDEVTIHSVVGIGTKVVMKKKIKKEEPNHLESNTLEQEDVNRKEENHDEERSAKTTCCGEEIEQNIVNQQESIGETINYV